MTSGAPTVGGAASRRPPDADDRVRVVVVAAAVAVLALVWAAAVDLRAVGGSPGVPLDAAWASTIEAARTPFLVAIARVFAWLGVPPGSLVVAAVIALFLWWRRGIRTALTFVVIASLSESNVRLMKAVDLRHRPHGGLWAGTGSFPSGHTAYAAVIAVTFGMLFYRAVVWIGGFAVVAAMALSRTVIGAHWLTDTLGGAACGAALAVLVWSLVPGRADAAAQVRTVTPPSRGPGVRGDR